MVSECSIIEWLSNFNESLLLPILLSFIAAIIFWLAFNYFPRLRKYKKIRPKVEFDIYQILFGLSFYFFELYKVNPWRRVEHQHDIHAGCLTKDEIEIWLQDKCLNDTFKFDENKDKLISIGNDLENIAKLYSDRLHIVLNFIDYLSVEEILLLQKIEYKLYTYNYIGNAASIIGEKKYYPMIPNLAYMTENIYELYKLYLSLRKKVLDYKLIDKNINKYIVPEFELLKAADFYYRGEYDKCIRCVKKNKHLKDNWLLFQATLKLGQKEKGYEILRELLSSSELELVSLRNYLTPFILEDEYVMDICKEMRNKAELKYCLKVVTEEILLRAFYERRNLELKNYYYTKLHGSTANGKEKYEEMKKNL